MSRTVKYFSRRSEVMGWYWRMWRKSLWKTHLMMFACVVILASIGLFDGAPTSLSGYLLVTSLGLLPIALFVLFPLLKFKPQERTFCVDDQGIQTTIGRQSKSIPWQEIINASVKGDCLVIQNRNLNAFIIPRRAFETSQAHQEFANFVMDHVQESGN